jgi:hypothetical protein
MVASPQSYLGYKSYQLELFNDAGSPLTNIIFNALVKGYLFASPQNVVGDWGDWVYYT